MKIGKKTVERVTSYARLDEIARRSILAAGRIGGRSLVCVLAPPPRLARRALSGARDWATRLLPSVVDTTDERPQADDTHRLAQRLGTERDGLLHFDGGLTGEDEDPALLAASIGTIRAGGTAVLVLAERRAGRSALMERLLETIRRSQTDSRGTVVLVRLHPRFGEREHSRRQRPEWAAPGNSAWRQARDASALAAQDEAFEIAMRRLNDDPRATLIVHGPRGVGKSALLGRLIKARSSLALPKECLVVTAANRASVRVLDRHAAGIEFRPPDAVARAEGLTLFVDEAASLPVAVLEKFEQRHPRLVLATTTDGYESAGRAFELRFERGLDALRPGWLRLALPRTLRWSSADRIAPLFDEAFLLHAASAAAAAGTGRPDRSDQGGPRQVVRIEPVDLQRASGLLRAVVNLLSANHYQSALADLGHLLSGRLETWILRTGVAILGVAIVSREGPIDTTLEKEILAGRRRLPDQLLPQLLARRAGEARPLDARYARIVRIAVEPAARRQGIATALIAGIAAASDPEGQRPDAIGASFAATPVACLFWQAAGYTTFNEGRRINPRSGLASRAVLRALSNRLRPVLARAAIEGRGEQESHRSGR